MASRHNLLEAQLNKTLSKLIDRFQIEDLEKHRLLETFNSTLINQRESSNQENEQTIVNSIQQKLQETQGSEQALRFNHLYNNLTTLQRLNKRKSIFSLLSHLSEPARHRPRPSTILSQEDEFLGRSPYQQEHRQSTIRSFNEEPLRTSTIRSRNEEPLRRSTIRSFNEDPIRISTIEEPFRRSTIRSQDEESITNNGRRSTIRSHNEEPIRRSTVRPHEEEELHRNIRRRLTLDPTPPPAEPVPIAVRLARARERLHERVTVSEIDLIHDLIYIFQGIDGQYIRYDPSIQDYTFTTHISKPTQDLVLKLTETGYLYTKIRDFIQSKETVSGLVGQSLCAAFHEELTEHYKFIATLEAQLEKQKGTLSLKRLVVWTTEPNQKLKLMGMLIDACANLKGGALISMIHNYTKHGDPFIKSYIVRILQVVSRPFYEILERWVYEGELDDPYHEFFVACDNTVSKDKLWQSKYTLRQDMLPSFLSQDVALKIYSIGKTLNFIRYSCHEDALISYSVHARYGDTDLVEKSIDVAYKETSKQLLSLLRQKYKLMDHLKAVKRYLLLGQGDFVQYLMDHLWDSLSKPASLLYRHNLTSILETAVRSSNAQFDDPDILNRLGVQLLEVQKDDMGWDVFSLEYHVDTPINTVFNAKSMRNYLKIFHFLWRLKRVEHTLSSAWEQWRGASREFSNIPEIQQDIQYAQLTIQRMVHFIYQLQHYVLFEVLECSWEKLETLMDKSVDLDSIIEAHHTYLQEITEKGFLSGGDKETHAVRLNQIFDCVLEYKVLLDHLYKFASSRDRSLEKLGRIRRFHQEMEDEFTKQVLQFLKVLQQSRYDEDLRSLSTRLDYNDFYSKFE